MNAVALAFAVLVGLACSLVLVAGLLIVATEIATWRHRRRHRSRRAARAGLIEFAPKCFIREERP